MGDRGNETILFVDDEPYLAEVGKEMLEDFGYVVEPVTDPETAMEIFRAQPERFDLVITDYTMPKMTGCQLSIEINRIRPDLPIVICSGIPLESEELAGVKVSLVMMKPLNMGTLLDTVRNVLDGQTLN